MRPLLLAAALVLPGLLAPTGAAIACMPVVHRPTCLLETLPMVHEDVPMPQPGESPEEYAIRVVVWLCTDLSRVPPQAEVSPRCGPPSSLPGVRGALVPDGRAQGVGGGRVLLA